MQLLKDSEMAKQLAELLNQEDERERKVAAKQGKQPTMRTEA